MPRFNPETSAVHIEGLTLLHYIGVYGAPQTGRGQQACNATCCDTGVIVLTSWGQNVLPFEHERSNCLQNAGYHIRKYT